MLPFTLICLLQTALGALAQQTSRQLSLNQVVKFNGTSSIPNPPIFTLPSSPSDISVSVALCSSESSSLRFILSNDTGITQLGTSAVGQPNVFEVVLGEDGFGNWTGQAPEGGFLTISGSGQIPFELGVSDQGPLHAALDELPLLGDTTSNQVLLFSPPFSAVNQTPPTYPNYTLPSANLSFPTGPSSPPNYTLYFTPTSSSSLTSLPRTGCALRALNGATDFNKGAADSDGLWLRDEQGWRWQWLIGGLSPSTNYTAFAIQDGTKVSQPINFVTKSGLFACPIVHSLPYCPSTAYAVPIDAPPAPAIAHDTSTLPPSVSAPFFEILTNFTTSLLTFPCGRDAYSPLVSCDDCQLAYRKWLCTVFFPRCSEESSVDVGQDAQQPISALDPQPPSATPRSPSLPPFSSAYDALLPCLETCTAVDRACPIAMGFKCPVPRFNASNSYGVGFIDSTVEGVQGGGSTGTSQDSWGNVWCNAG